MTNTNMNIHNIRIDGNTQSRVEINQGAVSDYAAVLKDGDFLPPIIVFFDGVDNWIADGFHRYFAFLACGKASIPVERRKGTQRDAILFSLKANTHHGLRPNSDDKRKAVLTMINDAEWSEMSDRAIARHCGCSHPLVSQMRNPKPEEPAAPASAPATPEPAASGNSSTPAQKPAQTQKQEEAAQVAQDAHGDLDPIEMLEESVKQVATLLSELFAMQADDKAAEILKQKRIADIAVRRQNELMDTVNAREKDLQKQANWLRRIGVALGEEDHSKLAAKVEALARAAKE